jgi:hypothetical protein
MAGCGKSNGGGKPGKATKGSGNQGPKAESGSKGGTASKGGACGQRASSGRNGTGNNR